MDGVNGIIANALLLLNTTANTTIATPAINVANAPTSINEGSSATIGIKLSGTVKDNYTVSVTSGDSSVLTVSPSSLIFTPTTFTIDQTVTITAPVDSNVTDEKATLSLISTGLETITLEITNKDIVAVSTGIVLSSVSSVFQEKTASITVALSGNPGTTRTVELVANTANSVAISPTTLTFTSANWNTPQTVTITGNSKYCGTTSLTATGTGLTSTTTGAISINTEAWGCYTDNGNGTVSFTGAGSLAGTNLLWMKCSQGQTYDSSTKSCTGTAGTFQYCTTANNACDNGTILTSGPTYNTCNALNTSPAGGYAGKATWRVPTKEELNSLTYCSNGPDTPLADGTSCISGFSPTIKTGFFPNTQSGNYCSSSTYAPFTSSAWDVNFSNGNVFFNFKTYNDYVRCVSGP